MKHIFLLLVIGLGMTAFSQSSSNFDDKYRKAKTLFEQKEFELAIQSFEELCKPSDNNSYVPYAYFYKAKGYIGLEKYSEARFVLVKLSKDLPDWAKQDEVKYLLGYTQLKSQQYIEAKTSIDKIEDEELSLKAKAMFYNFVVEEDSSELISKLQFKNKKDVELAEIIAHKLKSSSDSVDVFLLNYLIQDYDLEAEKFGGKSGVKKEKYQIALLLPLNLTKKSAYRNIKILNILKGAEYAIDSLKDIGVNAELKVFDTEGSLVKIQSILVSNDFQKMDLILGPLGKDACELVGAYAEENRILNFNYNRDDELFEGKEFVYSSISSNKTIGKSLAQTAYKSFDTLKPVEIYYHMTSSKEDSIVAKSYKDEIEKLGMRVSVFLAVKSNEEDAISKYKKSLSKGPAYKSNGKLVPRKEKISHVAVFAQKHNLMASTLISVWEGENRNAPVIAPKEWLDIHLISYDQFKRRNIHFTFLEYISSSNENVDRIKQKYQNEFGVRPSELKYVAVGYDITFFVGNQLNEFGTFFHESLQSQEGTDAVLTTGLDFSNNNTNFNVPLLKFGEEYEFLRSTEKIED